MSIIIQEDELKGLPDQMLVQEMEVPSGNFPQYLVFAELNRRKDLRERYAQQQAQAPASTMAEEMVAEVSGMGMPQQQMPMQMMRDGGIVRGFSNGSGGAVSRYRRPGYNQFGPEGFIALQEKLNELKRLGLPDDDSRIIDLQRRVDAARAEGAKPAEPEPWFGGFFQRGREAQREKALADLTEQFPDVAQVDVGDSQIYSGPRQGDISEEISRSFESLYPERSLGVGSVGANLTSPTQTSEPSYLEQYNTLLGEYETQPDNSDLDRFESLIEKYNPRPNKNVAQGKILAEIGRGLLSAPTFGEGIAAGIPGAVNAISEQQGLVADYNRNRLAAESALMQTKEARRKSNEDRLFQGRSNYLSANVDRETAGGRLSILRAESINDDIDRLDLILNDQTYNLDDEQKARLEREREMLVKRKNSLLGMNRERLTL